MKRMFGIIELIFNICYLIIALTIAVILLATASGNLVKILAACMALVLVIGDAFHLVPRILTILSRQENKFRDWLGRGKQIASITMTIFYILLWHMAVLMFDIHNIQVLTTILYVLAIIRITICMLPQNKWSDQYPPIKWGILRNIPFFILGMLIAVIFFLHRTNSHSLSLMWLAITVSFACYLPVVLLSNKNPKIGMLMLPKTVSYILMLLMCLYL